MRPTLIHNAAAIRGDLAFWRDLAGGDDDSARELLALFLAHTSEHISAIVTGLAGGNAHQVSRAAHSCVGSCSTCGFEALAQLFRQLEHEAGDLRLEALSHTVPLIVETFDRVQVRLSQVLAASTSDVIEESA